ncbi:MAG: ABC transporter ATP-binding protein [Thermoplasmata archaeon]|nr:ABC transporter ATP-binding protein [Thermoplasmata archaeon]
MPVLEAENLVKTYTGARGTIRALDDVSLTVEKGQLFAFLGRNGAGKTTFIRIASTLLLPTSGSVRLFGYDVVTQPTDVRDRIALVPQEGRPFDHLTPREHIREYLRMRGSGAERASDRAAQVLHAMGLDDSADEPALRLSGGLQQRTLVAMILATDAPFLFLDEPTLGMDPVARRQVWKVIRQAARSGSTILLTTHYLDEAEHLADELAVIEDGKILYRGGSEALKSRVGREVRVQFDGAVPAELLRPYGDLFHEEDRSILLTTRAHVPTLTELALSRNLNLSMGPVTLEEAFLKLVGRGIEEDEEGSDEGGAW